VLVARDFSRSPLILIYQKQSMKGIGHWKHAIELKLKIKQEENQELPCHFK